jgi:hypothetical protein
MADQIIIELIGDPSGLKPAEEALHELSKASRDNMDAFMRANEWAGKFSGTMSGATVVLRDFAEKAKESAMGINGIAEAAIRSVRALSDLNGIIAAGVVKTATEDYKTWATEVNSLTGHYTSLKAKIADTAAAMATTEGTLGKNSEEYKKLETSIRSYRGMLGDVNHKLGEHGIVLDESYAKSGKSGGAMTRLGQIFSGAAKDIEANGKAARESGDKHVESEGKFKKFTHTLGESAAKTRDSIDGAKELTRALGEMGEQVAKSAGNEAAAEEIKKKMTTALTVLTFAQNAATAATEAATLATTLLDIAMAPVTLVVLAVVAAVALMTIEFYGIYKAGQFVVNILKEKTTWFKHITAAADQAVKLFHMFADGARNIASALSGGLIEDTTLHKMNERLRESVKHLDEESALLKKQADQMEALGRSADSINAKKKEQLDVEKQSLDQQMEIAKNSKDESAQKEIQFKLDQNAIALAKNLADTTSGHIEIMKQQGAKAAEILEYQKQQNKLLIDQNDEEVKLLQVKISEAKVDDEHMKQMKADLIALQAAGLEYTLKDAELTKSIHKQKLSDANERRAKGEEWHKQQLADAKVLADAKLNITKAGSKEELDAKIADLNAAAAIELNNARGNKELQKAITEKVNQDIAAANSAFHLSELQDDKILIQAQLALAKEGSKQEYDIKMQLLGKERELISASDTLTANQKLKAFNELNQKEDALWSGLLAKEKAAADKALREAKQRGEDLRLTEIHNEEEKYDKEMQGWLDSTKRLVDKLKIVKAVHQAEIDSVKEAEKSGVISHDAAMKEMEKIDLHYKATEEKMQADIDKNKEASAKKQQANEKKIGQEAVKLAKEVADAIFAAAAEKRQQALDDSINKLEAQKTSELANHRLTASQKAAVEKKYHAEEAALKLKAWKADQKAKAEQALINGLLAVTSALATVQPLLPDGVIAAALALASSGIAVGQILSKSPPKFAKGVIGLHGPGTETSDSIAAYLSRGESVITAERTRQYKPVLEQIQAGIYQPLPVPMLSSLPRMADLSGIAPHAMSGTVGIIDYDRLGRAVAQALPKNKVQKLSFDKKGFSHYVITESGKLESYNNRYKE